MILIVNLENVSLVKDKNWILKNIIWTIHKGENWVLFGLNGAGKTALLLNAYYPTEGKVTVVGKEFGKTPLDEELSNENWTCFFLGIATKIMRK